MARKCIHDVLFALKQLWVNTIDTEGQPTDQDAYADGTCCQTEAASQRSATDTVRFPGVSENPIIALNQNICGCIRYCLPNEFNEKEEEAATVNPMSGAAAPKQVDQQPHTPEKASIGRDVPSKIAPVTERPAESCCKTLCMLPFRLILFIVHLIIDVIVVWDFWYILLVIIIELDVCIHIVGSLLTLDQGVVCDDVLEKHIDRTFHNHVFDLHTPEQDNPRVTTMAVSALMWSQSFGSVDVFFCYGASAFVLISMPLIIALDVVVFPYFFFKKLARTLLEGRDKMCPCFANKMVRKVGESGAGAIELHNPTLSLESEQQQEDYANAGTVSAESAGLAFVGRGANPLLILLSSTTSCFWKCACGLAKTCRRVSLHEAKKEDGGGESYDSNAGEDDSDGDEEWASRDGSMFRRGSTTQTNTVSTAHGCTTLVPYFCTPASELTRPFATQVAKQSAMRLLNHNLLKCMYLYEFSIEKYLQASFEKAYYLLLMTFGIWNTDVLRAAAVKDRAMRLDPDIFDDDAGTESVCIAIGKTNTMARHKRPTTPFTPTRRDYRPPHPAPLTHLQVWQFYPGEYY